MKSLPVLLCSALLVLEAAAQTLPGWTLKWADEFAQADGSPPDPAKWGHDTGDSGWGNNELQYYTDCTENARIENGALVIEARAEDYSGRNYTSARLLTQGKASWACGRFEARIKIPRGRGIWPAFWMLGANIGDVGWPRCGEIDILENIGSEPSIVHGTLHGPGYSGANGISGARTVSGALAEDFHVYAIEWEADRIRWFLDGLEYFTLTPTNLPAGGDWVFDQAQFLLLNVAVGGNWPGSPDTSTQFPQRMTVDYVRVYEADAAHPPDRFVTVDPAEMWRGYMNVSDLPAAGGAVRSSGVWATADLRASFAGATLTLSPNTISNPSPYWYIGGGAPGSPGNKIMKALVYVEKTGSLSGENVVFSGRVTSNTLTSAHHAEAFIRDFAPDHSSFKTVTAPLVDGLFSLSLATLPGAGRHVQYGFQTTGVNVWPTDAAPFGSVRITAAAPDPYAAWIGGFEFPAFPNPDLTTAGDPDGDGQSNLAEFAFDGDPAHGSVSGKVRTRTGTVAGEQALLLTLAVLEGADFDGAPAKTAAVGRVAYAIEGSNGLMAFDREVTEVVPADADGLPGLNSGWTYRTFRLEGAIGGAEPRGATGFLRARVSEIP